MELIKENGKFIARCTFDERAVPKGAGFRWDPTARRWWTDDAKRAAKLAQYADVSARAALTQLAEMQKEAVELSRATDADVVLPCPEGLDYMPFQRAGIAYGLNRESVLIGDEMGLGKTIQAIGMINASPLAKRVLVVCPASLKINWKRELEKWLVRPLTVGVADTKKALWPSTDVVVINYDITHKFQNALREIVWDVMIVDEAHYLKNPKTRRTQQIMGHRKQRATLLEPIKARRRVFLTGTPIVNRPAELWPIVSFLAPDVFRSWGHYMKRYCNAVQGRFGWDTSGAANLGELQQILRENIMVRRLKSDVLTELPPKVRQVVEIPANGDSKTIDAENRAWAAHAEIMDQLRVAVELAKASESVEDFRDAIHQLQEGARVAFTEMAKARQETAVAKIPYVLAHLEDASGKVVVFAHHKAVIKGLKEALGSSAVVLVGDSSQAQRQEAIDKFQKDTEVKYFLGSIHAAGVGITLTAASHVVFAELDWVPGNVSQCEDRCHRIGQQDSVFVQHLVFEGSIDANMAKTIVQKQKVIDKALDVEPDPIPVVPVTEEPASAHVTRKMIDRSAETITIAQIEAVHEGLRAMSGICDGAWKIDGVGFNRFDTRIGKELAMRPELTARQAVLGRSILKKYHSQLGKDFTNSLG